jgi:hypothetical protein
LGEAGCEDLIDLGDFLHDLQDTKENKELLKRQGPNHKIDISFFLLWTAMVGE